MLDQIFGENNFQNEIVWRRTTAHADTHGFGHVHDIIFRYSNGAKPTFNVELKSYPEDYIEKYFIYEDEYVATRGKHWRADITGAGLRNGETGKPWKGSIPRRSEMAATGCGRHRNWTNFWRDGRDYLPPGGGFPQAKKIRQ